MRAFVPLNAVIAALVIAAGSYPVVASGRSGAALVSIVLTLLTPLLVPGEHRLARFLAMIVAVTMAARLYDLHHGVKLGFVPGWRRFIVSLPNLSSIVLRKADREPLPGGGRSLRRLVRGLLLFAAGLLLSIGVFRLDWRPWPFAVEHAAKVLSFFAALVPFTAAGASFLRLLGWRPVEPMDNPFAARTPADFWRRYNRATHQFLLEDVFKPAGGARRPVRATIVTFAISALIHEYVFDVSASRIQGYQTLFFLVQGCAVAATARFRPRGPTAIPWVAATLTFNLASGVLFFASLDEIVPFYTLRAP